MSSEDRILYGWYLDYLSTIDGIQEDFPDMNFEKITFDQYKQLINEEEDYE